MQLPRRHNVERGSKEYYDLELKYNQLAHRHRFDLVMEVANLNDMTNYFKKYFTGETYTAEIGYAGPGDNTGNTTFSIGFGGDFPEEYGGSLEKMNRADWWKGSDAWETLVHEQCPRMLNVINTYIPMNLISKDLQMQREQDHIDTIRMQAKLDTHQSWPGEKYTNPCHKQNQTGSEGICRFLVNISPGMGNRTYT